MPEAHRMSPESLKRFLIQSPDDVACRMLCERAGQWSKAEAEAIREAVHQMDPGVLRHAS